MMDAKDEKKQGDMVKIHMTDHCRGTIYLNGQEVVGATAFSLTAGMNSLNEMVLYIQVPKVEFEGPAYLFDFTETRPYPHKMNMIKDQIKDAKDWDGFCTQPGELGPKWEGK